MHLSRNGSSSSHCEVEVHLESHVHGKRACVVWEGAEGKGLETAPRQRPTSLALGGRTSTQIASLVCRSQDTVVRVLKRFLQGGLEAVPRRTAPGRRRTITTEWEVELLPVIELDPHEVGVASANWTTQMLADYLGEQTGIIVTEETVRIYLHAHGYVCKRPTWTLRRKAGEQTNYVGNACG